MEKATLSDRGIGYLAHPAKFSGFLTGYSWTYLDEVQWPDDNDCKEMTD